MIAGCWLRLALMLPVRLQGGSAILGGWVFRSPLLVGVDVRDNLLD